MTKIVVVVECRKEYMPDDNDLSRLQAKYQEEFGPAFKVIMMPWGLRARIVNVNDAFPDSAVGDSTSKD